MKSSGLICLRKCNGISPKKKKSVMVKLGLLGFSFFFFFFFLKN